MSGGVGCGVGSSGVCAVVVVVVEGVAVRRVRGEEAAVFHDAVEVDKNDDDDDDVDDKPDVASPTTARVNTTAAIMASTTLAAFLAVARRLAFGVFSDIRGGGGSGSGSGGGENALG